ncbi:protein kinase domain-containing protein [Neobacillus sp. SAB-20_R2A]|uniref:protein kinase domain-containing protein n=1 Tax=Neobacillus sp. SAB-20_R2A TaxID=3120519 RepID=UPI003C6E94E9
MRTYTFHRLIDSGATSQIYEAVDNIGKNVIVKKVKNAADAEDEVNILKRLPAHNQLIQMTDSFIEGSNGYIIFDHHPGEKLGHFKKGKPRQQKSAIQITLKILQGLKAVHQHGILHCDITPHNVIISEENPETVKIIDFGSAVLVNEQGRYTGRHKGATKWYRAPELKKESSGFTAKLDFSSDLYSAASVCLYLLTGAVPYRKKQACLQIENKELQYVLRKATKKNKKKRYQSTQDFIDALLPFS